MDIKVCGMNNHQNMEEVATLGPAYMGFIFYPESPRYLDQPIPKLSKSIKRVGVFVTDSIQSITAKVKQYNLNVVQLHGEESANYIKELKQTLPKSTKIWKVFAVRSVFDFDLLTPFEPLVDAFLFDTKGPAPGGNGFAFDWNILSRYPSTTPVVISGGIGLDHKIQLQQLIATGIPLLAIDVNSQFELEPGIKNYKDLKTFFNYEL